MEINEILASPPTAFDGFSVTKDRQGKSGDPPTARYQLACRKCGRDAFRLQEILSGEHGAAGVEATCVECGENGTVFHASRHGYDGRLGHLRFLQEITGRQLLCDGDEQPVREAQIACEVTYSIEPVELSAIAATESVPTQDLFDGFAIFSRTFPADAWRKVWDYECA